MSFRLCVLKDPYVFGDWPYVFVSVKLIDLVEFPSITEKSSKYAILEILVFAGAIDCWLVCNRLLGLWKRDFKFVSASNRLLYDANRLLGFKNVIFHFCNSANRLLYDANRLHCLENVIFAPGTASNRLLSGANRLLLCAKFLKTVSIVSFKP